MAKIEGLVSLSIRIHYAEPENLNSRIYQLKLFEVYYNDFFQLMVLTDLINFVMDDKFLTGSGREFKVRLTWLLPE